MVALANTQQVGREFPTVWRVRTLKASLYTVPTRPSRGRRHNRLGHHHRAPGRSRGPRRRDRPWIRLHDCESRGSGEEHVGEGAGVELERPLHTLRHSYARALRRVEAPLEAVQYALDHSTVATTSVYLRQLEGLDDPWAQACCRAGTRRRGRGVFRAWVGQ